MGVPYADPTQQKKAQQESYERNRERVAARSRAKRKANRKWLADQKQRPCVDCGGEFPPCAMDYHHRDPSQKIMPVGIALTKVGRQRVIEEIAKCDLLCSNCHRIREYFTA